MKPKFFYSKPLVPTLIAVGSVLTSSLHAQVVEKASSGTNLNDAASWTGPLAPMAGNIATWTGTSLDAGLTFGANASWLGIATASGAPAAIDISGAGALTLGASGIDLSLSSTTLTLGMPIVLGASQTWQGAVDFGVISTGQISGGFPLNFGGAGTNTLNGPNIHSGGTILEGNGVLKLGNSSALGNSGLTLQSSRTNSDETVFVGGGITLAKPITLNLVTGREGITSNSGNNTSSGAINIVGSASNHVYFKSDEPGSTFTLAGPITAPNMTEGMSFRGEAGAFGVISGQVDISGFFQINGAATWTVSSTGNHWTRTIIQGLDGGFTLGADNALATTAKVSWGTDTNGALDLAGFNQTVGGLDRGATANSPKVGNSSTTADSLLRINGGGDTFSATIVNTLGSGNRKLSLELLSGSQTLSGTNTYTGATTITGGTLTVDGSLAAGSAVSIQSGGNLSGSGTVNGPVAVSGILTGTGTMAGTVNVQSGGVVTGSPVVSGAMTVQSGGMLMGTGAMNGGVTLQNGSVLTPGDGNSAAVITLASLTLGSGVGDSQQIRLVQGLSSVSVTGGVTHNGITNLNLVAPGGFTSGLSNLVTYTGPTVTNGFSLAGLPPRAAGSLQYNPGSIDLNVTNKGDTAQWTGNVNGIWNTTSGNWNLVDAGTPTTYIAGTPGDQVLFADLVAPSAAITLGTTVSPASVNFDNTSTAYSLNGSGGIAGFTGLEKKGTGTLTLGTNNSFTGIVNVSAGTLILGHAHALGSTAGGTTVNDATTLALVGGVNILGETLTARGGGFGNTGGLRNISGDNNWTGIIILSNSLRITSDSGTLSLNEINASNRSVIMNGAGNVTINGAISGTTGGITMDNVFSGGQTGTLTLKGGDTITGAITVNNGTLSLESNHSASAGAVTVGGVDSVGGTLTATINHSVGTLSASGLVLVGSAASSVGSYSLSGGTLNSTSTNVNGFILGTNTGASGSFTLGGSGVLTAAGTFQVGRSNSNASNTTGVYTQTAGTASLKNFALGGAGANNNATTATVTITGGTFSVSGVFANFSGGTNSTSSITIGGTADVTLPAFPSTHGAGATATLTFDGGSLRPAAASPTYMGGLTHANLTNNGAKIDVPSGKDITISQVLENAAAKTGNLTKTGTGTLTLSGVNGYTGSTTVNAGILAVNGTALDDSTSLVINSGKVAPTGIEKVNTLFFGGAQQPAGKYGAPGAIGANFTDGVHFSGTAGLVEVISGPAVIASYANWAAAYAPGQTPGQDHDNDGVENGVEYFMGQTGSTFTSLPGPINGKVTWPKDPTYSGTFFIQTSSTMAAGSWVNVPVNGVNPKDNGNSVEYTLPTGQPKLFTRLKVTPN